MRRISRRRCGAGRSFGSAASAAHQTWRGDRGRPRGLGAIGEAPAKTLLEVREMREHELARPPGIVSPHGLDELLVRLLCRAARLVIAEIADRGHEQLAVCL